MPVLERIQLPRKQLIIKVSLVHKGDVFEGVATDPIIVESIHSLLSDRVEEIIVVESDATAVDAFRAARSSGLLRTCERLGIRFVNLSKEKDRVKLRVPRPYAISQFELPRIVFDYEVISAAKMKTHSETGVTLGIKNLFGLLPEKYKFKYHLFGISKVVVDLFQVVKPVLTVIDGFLAMEGNGPTWGDVVRMDTVISGNDALATDWVTSKVMGFDPQQIFHLSESARIGLGSVEDVAILGEPLEKAARKFRSP